MTTRDAPRVRTDGDRHARATERVARALAAIDAEVARLDEERARRLAPLQRELSEALAAAGTAPTRIAGVARGEARVWITIARRIGVDEFAASDIVEIAHTLGHHDIVGAAATKKLSRWVTRGRVEKVAVARYRFTAAGRIHYRIGRDEPADPPGAPRTRRRSALTVAAAMSGSAAGRRRAASVPTRRGTDRASEG